MKSATKATVSTFGALAAMAGFEHGVGEIVQGNVAPDGMMILSWDGSDLFAIVNGEPAMTIIPNLLITGVLAILVSLLFLVWVTTRIQSEHGGLVLILLSAVLLLFGGGFGPPLLGIILGVTATRINAPLNWWRARRSRHATRFLSALWPWLFAASLAAWMFLFPGSLILDYFVNVSDPATVISLAALAALCLLLLTIFAGLARDIQEQPGFSPAAGLREPLRPGSAP